MKQTKRTLLSLLLVFAMLATCLVAFSVTTSAANPAEDTKKDGTLPAGVTIGDNTASTKFSGGSGTEADPWQIANASDWYYFITYCNAAERKDYFKLTGNIYLRDKYESYGPDNMPTVPDEPAEIDGVKTTDRFTVITKAFKGVLDGGGYAIYNLYNLANSSIGIFATLSGTVKNLNLYGGIYVGRNQTGSNGIGTICGTLSNGVIENCYSSVSIATGGAKVGGFAGKVAGTSTISNCTYAGVISYSGGTNNAAAGIAGRVEGNLTLTGCVNSAKIVSSGGRVGGLVGFFNSSAATLSFTNCVNTGDIRCTATGSNDGTGGLLGRFHDGAKLEMYYCANTGDVVCETTGARVGGLTSEFYKTDLVMIGCYNSGSVSGAGASGLMACCVPTGTGVIAGCYSETPTLTNTKSGKDGSGILFGWMKNASAIHSVATKASDSTAKAVGSFDSATVSNSITTYAAGATGLTDGTALGLLNATATDETLASYTTNWVGYVQGATAPFLKVFAAQVAIDGATLSLNDTMTLKLFVKASSVAKIDGLKSIMVNDGTETGNYKGTLDTKTGNYVFEITGLAAKDMGTAKTYTVKYTLSSDTANPIVCNGGVEYSPLQYAINMYKKNAADAAPNANFAALLVSLTRYIDAAEVKANGSSTVKETFTTATGYAFNETDSTNADKAYAAIVAKDAESTFDFPEGTAELGAELTSGITLIVKPAEGKTFNDVSVKIGDKELAVETADGTWRVTGINPGDLYNELTFTITTNEGTVTGTYSIARYLNSYMDADLENETAIETLAKATALYMDAFITYKTLG